MKSLSIEDFSAPNVTLEGRLGWRINISEIIFDDPPFLVVNATPIFPGCHSTLAERGVVFDVFCLIASIQTPGAYDLLTCECGYPPDAYIEEAVLVSHPDAHTIIWELDIKGLGSWGELCDTTHDS